MVYAVFTIDVRLFYSDYEIIYHNSSALTRGEGSPSGE